MRRWAPLPAGALLALLSVRPSVAAQLMIGQLEASRSSADWDEFSSAAPVSTYVVGNPSLPPFVTANLALVRSWLGNSTCNGCYSGIAKKQRLKFEGLVAGRQYTVTVYASYWSGGNPFTATIVYGQGTVTAGATSAFGSGYGAAGTPWKVAFVPATEEVTLELGNGATSGDAYMMLDAIAAEVEPLRVRMSAALVALGRTESTSSAADWDEFTGTADVETYTVGDHLVPTQSRVRPWVGHSTCSSCRPGNTKAQRITWWATRPGAVYRVFVRPSYVSTDQTWTARVVGNGSVIQGATAQFAPGYRRGETWAIAVVAADLSLTVELTNGAVTGDHYMLFDSLQVDEDSAGLSTFAGQARWLQIGDAEASGSSRDWDEFTGSQPTETYGVGVSTPSSMRAWVGHSSCGGCGAGVTKTQQFRLSGLSAGFTYRLEIHPGYVSSTCEYQASAVVGALVLRGQSVVFPAGYPRSSQWTIEFLAQGTDAVIEIGNGRTSGDDYLYIDHVGVIAPTGWASWIVGDTKPNAYVDPSGRVVPLYRVGNRVYGTGFVQAGSVVTEIDEEGAFGWSRDVGTASLSGGLDFDSDGVPDLVLGYESGLETRTAFVTGLLGTTFTPVVLGPTCLTAAGSVSNYVAGQPEHRFPWTISSVLFGRSWPLLVAPRCGSTSWFLGYSGGFFMNGWAYNASTSAFDAYAAARPSAFGPAPHVEDSEGAHGLLMDVAGEPRAVVFTSGRVMQYRVPFSPGLAPLVADRPFRTGPGGRNEGLVAVDPSDGRHVALLSGVGARAVYDDVRYAYRSSGWSPDPPPAYAERGTAGYYGDPRRRTERHVTLYDTVANSVQTEPLRSVSAAGPVWPNIQGAWPIPVDPQYYERQLMYPSHPFLRVRAGQASRLAYNEYAGGSWILHVTEPGSTVDALLVPGELLWDVQDLDGDGVDELVLSPTSGQSPYLRTEVGRWSESTRSIDVLRSYAEQAIPYFTRFFPAADRVSRATLGIPAEALDPAYVAVLASLGLVPGGATVVVPERDSYLYPVLVTKGGAFGPFGPVARSMLLLRSATGLVEVPVN